MPMPLFDVGGIVAVAGLTLTAIFSTVQNTRRLYRAEPLGARDGSRLPASGFRPDPAGSR
jgi:hypothetical protein